MIFDLSNRTALVTGASSGIGREIALALGAAGAHVIAAARSSCTDAVVGTSGEAVMLDLSNPAAAVPLFEERRIDILVNNAGIIRRDPAVSHSVEDWDAVMDLNLKAVFLTSQAFARAHKARGTEHAAIINIASLLSFQGGILVPSYAAAKHAVAGLTKAFCNEWAAEGINVNAIAPGYIATAATKMLRDDPERSQAILTRIPAGRWGEASDIAQTAVFLASSAARYINGAVIPVDGGWLAR